MYKIKIAVLGLGVVGSHVVKLLEKNSYILDDTKCEIVAIGAKNKKKKRKINISKYKWVGDYKSLIQFKPDLIIETIGGTGKYINDLYKFCLKNKISLITANKAQLAEKSNLFFEGFDKLNLFLRGEYSFLLFLLRVQRLILQPQSLEINLTYQSPQKTN